MNDEFLEDNPVISAIALNYTEFSFTKVLKERKGLHETGVGKNFFRLLRSTVSSAISNLFIKRNEGGGREREE